MLPKSFRAPQSWGKHKHRPCSALGVRWVSGHPWPGSLGWDPGHSGPAHLTVRARAGRDHAPPPLHPLPPAQFLRWDKPERQQPPKPLRSRRKHIPLRGVGWGEHQPVSEAVRRPGWGRKLITGAGTLQRLDWLGHSHHHRARAEPWPLSEGSVRQCRLTGPACRVQSSGQPSVPDMARARFRGQVLPPNPAGAGLLRRPDRTGGAGRVPPTPDLGPTRRSGRSQEYLNILVPGVPALCLGAWLPASLATPGGSGASRQVVSGV